MRDPGLPAAWAPRLLVPLGLFTRPAAFLASGTMAVACWHAHAPQSFFAGPRR